MITAPCRIEIEQTRDSLHAHVEIDGVEIGPGDRVIIADAPGVTPFGESCVYERTATIMKANWFERIKAHIEGYLELTELYEAGFSERRKA
jgi:regulator of RNase E activity RraA